MQTHTHTLVLAISRYFSLVLSHTLLHISPFLHSLMEIQHCVRHALLFLFLDLLFFLFIPSFLRLCSRVWMKEVIQIRTVCEERLSTHCRPLQSRIQYRMFWSPIASLYRKILKKILWIFIGFLKFRLQRKIRISENSENVQRFNVRLTIVRALYMQWNQYIVCTEQCTRTHKANAILHFRWIVYLFTNTTYFDLMTCPCSRTPQSCPQKEHENQNRSRNREIPS